MSEGTHNLGDYFSLQRGTTYKSRLLGLDGPILLGLGTIKKHGGFRSDSIQTYGGESPSKLLVRPGELYLSLKDVTQSAVLLGAVARLPLDQPVGRLTQDTVKLEPRSAEIPMDYLYWLMRTPQYRSYCRSHATGTTNLGLSREDFLAFNVPHLNCDRQHIVRCLEFIEQKSALNLRINETLEAMAHALFKSWFIDPLVLSTATGRLPHGWTASTLGDHITLQRGTTYSGKLVGMPGPALLGLGSVQPGGGFREDNYKTYGGECPPKITLIPGDMFVALKGATKDGSMVGSIARVPPSVKAGRLTQDTVKLEFRTSRAAIKSYIYRLLLTKHYREYCAGRITGSAQVGLSRDDFLSYPVPMPPDGLLDTFERNESAISGQQHVLNAQNRTVAELCDTLLPRLFSGELRVAYTEHLLNQAV